MFFLFRYFFFLQCKLIWVPMYVRTAFSACIAILYLAGRADGICTKVKPSEPCSSKYIKFILYRGSHQKIPIVVEPDDDLKKYSWDSKQMNHMLINGFGDLPTITSLLGFKDAIFVRFPEGNVFLMEYAKLSNIPCYIEAVSNMKYAGKCLAEFLEKLGDASNGTLNIHILGTSLGAHVPANAAPFMKRYNISRVTGMDAAGPLFDEPNGGRALSLSPDSAEFVDCIHSNGVAYGTKKPLGHVDIYVNNATFQPGCIPPHQGDLMDIHDLKSFSKDLYAVLCSHILPTILVMEDFIHPDGFWARKCDGEFNFTIGECVTPLDQYNIIGVDIDLSIRGNYSLRTNAFPPLARGKPTSMRNSTLLQ